MASQRTEENKVGRVRKRKVSKDQVELLLEAERVAAELEEKEAFSHVRSLSWIDITLSPRCLFQSEVNPGLYSIRMALFLGYYFLRRGLWFYASGQELGVYGAFG
jgi:hypothetical protein